MTTRERLTILRDAVLFCVLGFPILCLVLIVAGGTS